MFKIYGCIITSFCAYAVIIRKNYILYINQQFLKESVMIADIFYILADSGITYKDIISKSGIEKCKIYNSFDLYNQDIFWSNLYKENMIDKLYLNEISSFFINLGKKSSVKERSFIAQNQKIIAKYLENIQKDYREKRKTNSILSISAGICVFIFLI